MLKNTTYNYIIFYNLMCDQLHQTWYTHQLTNLWLFSNRKLNRFALHQANWFLSKLQFTNRVACVKHS